MGKLMNFLLATLFSLAYVVTGQSDTLTLQRADGSTYEMEGEIEQYEDGKFVIMLDSGGKTSIPVEQVKVIKFEMSKKQKVTKAQGIKKPKQAVPSRKTETKNKTESLRKTGSTAKDSTRTRTKTASKARAAKVSGISFEEVQRALGMQSDLTDLQKKDIWGKKFEGKRISWVGTVDGARPATFTDGAYLTVRFGGAGVLHLNCTVKDKWEVMHLKKGQKVRVQGLLRSWSQFLDMLSVDPVDKVEPVVVVK